MILREKIRNILNEEVDEKLKKLIFVFLERNLGDPYFRPTSQMGAYEIDANFLKIFYYSELRRDYVFQGKYPMAYFDETNFDFIKKFINIFGEKKIPIIFEWINKKLFDRAQFDLDLPKTYIIGKWNAIHKTKESDGIFIYDI